MMTAFICCYAAFICIFICAAILSVQLLSSSRKYRYQYDQLRRMGTSEREIRGLIRRQTAVYFLLPMGLPFFFLILYMAGIGFAFPVYRGYDVRFLYRGQWDLSARIRMLSRDYLSAISEKCIERYKEISSA